MGFSLVWQQFCFPQWENVCGRLLGTISGTEKERTCNISVQYICFSISNIRLWTYEHILKTSMAQM